MQKAADKILRAQFKLICSNVKSSGYCRKVYISVKLRLLNEKELRKSKWITLILRLL